MALQTSTVHAAGGVVLRVEAGHLQVLLIATHGSRRWSLPKGRLEAGESADIAAIREVLEETGIQATVVAPLDTVEYFFFGQRTHRYHKFVEYFLMAYERGDLVPQISEVDAAQWCAIPEAVARLTYPNDRKLVLKGVELWQDHFPISDEGTSSGTVIA
jgi:8-oxo-dGTP diphosphatase